MTDLFLSAELLAAMEASGRTKQALAGEIAVTVGCSASYASSTLTAGYRVSHDADGRNKIVFALCALLKFPIDRALSQRPFVSVDERFDQALAAIRASRRFRLTDEDCHARRPNSAPY